MAGGHIGQCAAREVLVRQQTVDVGAEGSHVRSQHAENVASVRIARLLDADSRLPVDEQRRNQIERMLRADRHHDLVRAGMDAAPWQDLKLQLLDQCGIIAVDQVACPVVDLGHAQCRARAFAPVVGRKKARIELAEDEGIGLRLPVGRLADVAVHRRSHCVACRPVLVVAADRLRWLRSGGGGLLGQARDEITAALP